MAGIEPLTSRDLRNTSGWNTGYRCNMSCAHCHVAAGPGRDEIMERETVQAVIKVLDSDSIDTLDITGGAPELHPDFRTLVVEAKAAGKKVVVRTNLTIIAERGMEYLPEFYAHQGVQLIASLPCYLEQNVNTVRGNGAFAKSIDTIRTLNRAGFGTEQQGALPLGLVYNPAGAFLPPQQSVLESDYKRELQARYGISFTRLYAFTNMPVGRFRESLIRRNEFEKYQALLASAFNPAAVDKIMCRTIINVGWEGTLYDCDFNQALGIPVTLEKHRTVRDFDRQALSQRTIAVGAHCYGCTAGQGST